MTYREMEIPCYNCNERHVGCHGKCDRYASFFDSRRKANNENFDKKEVEMASIERVRRSVRRAGKNLKNSGF